MGRGFKTHRRSHYEIVRDKLQRSAEERDKRVEEQEKSQAEIKGRIKEKEFVLQDETSSGKQDLWIHRNPRWGLKVRRFK